MQRTMPTKSKKKQARHPLRVVSLFAGAGGLEIALCNTLPVEAIVSSDSNPVFLKTTEVNLPIHFPKVRHTAIVSDARSLTGKMLIEALGGPCDLVMGGPPCDDFTKYGRRRGLEGDKGPLIFEFSRIVAEIRPRAFLFENVPNILKVARRGFEQMIADLQAAGYNSSWKLLKACDYGVPTIRERVFLAGTLDNGVFAFPEPTHGKCKDQCTLFDANSLKSYILVSDVLHDVPAPYSKGSERFSNHQTRQHSEQTIAKLALVAQGKWVRGSYRYRSPWNGLCSSLTAGEDHATKSHIHPLHDREMSVREYARIHMFPDSWIFQGNHHNGIKQVANAVPIPLGIAVMRSLGMTFNEKVS
jgi:DNA (cytosine-5)-methyltransferase 1